MEIANVFIVILVAAAAWLGVAAVIQKRVGRPRSTEDRPPHAPSH
jgi:hypothetical protein